MLTKMGAACLIASTCLCPWGPKTEPPMQSQYLGAQYLGAVKAARRSLLVATACIVSALAFPQISMAQTAAQNWPSRAVRLILPLGPGSGSDISARLLAEKLQKKWGRAVVIENRPGGDSLIALGAYASANDDHVLFYGPAGTFTVHPFQHEKLPYDPAKDLQAIASVSYTTLAVAVPTELGINSLTELVVRAKQNPGVLNAAAAAGLSELFWDGFVRREGLAIPKVPYRNIVDGTVDLSSNRLQVMFTALPMIKPVAETGKVKILAITSDKRVSSDPEVPTSAESGFPTFAIAGLVGLVGPSSMPIELRRRIGADILEVGRDPAFTERLLATGQEPNLAGADEFAAEIGRQTAAIAVVADLLGMARKLKQ